MTPPSNLYVPEAAVMVSKSVITGLLPEALVTVAHAGGVAAAVPPVPAVVPLPLLLPPLLVPALALPVPPVAEPLVPLGSTSSLPTQAPVKIPPAASTLANAK